MENILELAYKLHDLLLNSNEYKILKDYEDKMLNDDNANSLINNYHICLEKYNFDKSEEVLKKLSNAKLLMDQNELVILYKKAYKDYQILVGNITDVVFKDFKKDTFLDKLIRAKWFGS